MKEKITQKLQQKFAPTALEVVDKSHIHAAHLEAKKAKGRGHYTLYIEAKCLQKMPLLQAHKAIYEALAEEMDSIHALEIKLQKRI